MIRSALRLSAVLCFLGAGLARAQPPPYQPPGETARFTPGEGDALAARYCLPCHSADYIQTQPRSLPSGFWEAEVGKMKTAFGAQIPDADSRAIVAYLNAAYGSKAPATASRTP